MNYDLIDVNNNNNVILLQNKLLLLLRVLNAVCKHHDSQTIYIN